MSEAATDIWNADDYAANARFVADQAADLVDWLDPRPGERILDLGCGDGALTKAIAEHGAAVVGVDPSPAMVAAARECGIHALIGDGQALDDVDGLDSAFDAVFSNAALHWMVREPASVIEGVHARLKPGGRFVAEMGAAGNIEPIRAALRAEAAEQGLNVEALDPWYFPTEKQYLDQLRAAGFSIQRQSCFERPTRLPGDVADWLTTLAGPFIEAVSPGEARQKFIDAVRTRLAPVMQDTDGGWTAPYVRLRFVVRKLG